MVYDAAHAFMIPASGQASLRTCLFLLTKDTAPLAKLQSTGLATLSDLPDAC